MLYFLKKFGDNTKKQALFQKFWRKDHKNKVFFKIFGEKTKKKRLFQNFEKTPYYEIFADLKKNAVLNINSLCKIHSVNDIKEVF